MKTLIILSALLLAVSCAKANHFSATPGQACYRLEVDDWSPDARVMDSSIPEYLILDSASHQGATQPRDTLHVYRSGTKRSPFWRQNGDSIFVFSPITKFAQLRFRFAARLNGLAGEAWYSADIETNDHQMIPVTAERVTCR